VEARSNDLLEIERIEDVVREELCPKTKRSPARPAPSSDSRKAEVDFGSNGTRSRRGRAPRDRERKRERDNDTERGTSGGRQHRVTSTGPIFGSAKRKRNDRAVMHHDGARSKSSDCAHGRPIPVVPTHAGIISADRGIFIAWGPFGLEQMPRRRRRCCRAMHRNETGGRFPPMSRELDHCTLMFRRILARRIGTLRADFLNRFACLLCC